MHKKLSSRFLFCRFVVKCLNGYFITTCFHFFSENDLTRAKQSGFRPGDPCTNQLLSIPHEFLSAFEDGHKGRGVFLDISKAFDRVWDEVLLFKLQQNRISGLLN